MTKAGEVLSVCALVVSPVLTNLVFIVTVKKIITVFPIGLKLICGQFVE